MNVLIVGSGGREHALGWKISQCPGVERLFFAPGNPGTALLGTNLPVEGTSFEELREELLRNSIGMVVVGPEVPLAAGIHDFFAGDPLLPHLRVIGPTRSGARLESSKDFAKAFMTRHRIPTARYRSFARETLEEGFLFLESLAPPYVIKADGLAAGKGVVIAGTLEEARLVLSDMLGGKFGRAGERVVIEEFLRGTEVSVFLITDGRDYVLLPEAKDYKRIGAGDTGPNTGGMGAVSPVPFAGAGFMEKVRQRIIEPTLEGLQKEGIAYTGFLFLGLIDCGGDPFMIEYNVRLGDPETEAIMPRVGNDFLDLLVAASEKRLAGRNPEVSSLASATVMLVSEGYPGPYPRGRSITGLGETEGCLVFHAGTAGDPTAPVTAGGRVLAITATGTSLTRALETCYRNAQRIRFDGKYFRPDIGLDV